MDQGEAEKSVVSRFLFDIRCRRRRLLLLLQYLGNAHTEGDKELEGYAGREGDAEVWGLALRRVVLQVSMVVEVARTFELERSTFWLVK
jgi:hypothetical protein